MIKAPLSQVKDNFAEFIKKAGKEQVIATIYGRPAAAIIGLEEEATWILIFIRQFLHERPVL